MLSCAVLSGEAAFCPIVFVIAAAVKKTIAVNLLILRFTNQVKTAAKLRYLLQNDEASDLFCMCKEGNIPHVWYRSSSFIPPFSLPRGRVLFVCKWRAPPVSL